MKQGKKKKEKTVFWTVFSLNIHNSCEMQNKCNKKKGSTAKKPALARSYLIAAGDSCSGFNFLRYDTLLLAPVGVLGGRRGNCFLLKLLSFCVSTKVFVSGRGTCRDSSCSYISARGVTRSVSLGGGRVIAISYWSLWVWGRGRGLVVRGWRVKKLYLMMSRVLNYFETFKVKSLECYRVQLRWNF